MRRLPNNTTIAILALILLLPIAASASLNGTQALTSGQILSLDTGTVVTSGGDILWTGSSIMPQGSAKAFSLTALSSSFSGSSSFGVLTQSTLSAFGSEYSGSAIPLSSLAVNDIFAVLTNGGNYAALLVTAQSGTSITLQFVSFVSTVPTITQVLNNYGLIPAGFTNSGIAPGTLFIIKGSLLASATSTLQSTTGGSVLPATLNGATVAVKVGSVTVAPPFYYASATQLDLVLPSNTPVGAGTVTVTYNGQTSAPFNIQVLTSAFGFATYYGTSGNGLAHVQDLNYGYYSYANSIPPGATVRLIGSGLGADPTRDVQYVQPTPSSAINALAHVYVGGLDSPIFYQGPEGFPGVDEVDVTIPSNAPTGCYISVAGVSTTGVSTNFLTLPIGTGQCQDPGLGYSGSLLTTLSGQTTVKTGFVEMSYSTSPATSGSGTTVTTEASANFQSYTGSGYGTGSGIVSIGGCIVAESLVSIGGSIGTTTSLNAGTITVTGPNAAPVTLMSVGTGLPGSYFDMLPTGFLTMSGGSFQFQGTAGTQVGAFTASVNFPTPLLQWTNQAASATVTRSAGLPITWTGGSAGTYVIISGTSFNTSASGFFTCLAPVAAGQFTVPSYVLGTLPASTNGSLSVANETVPQSFTATGLDYGFAIGYESTYINATYN
jgi:uncharacterized protein (TIGR03437 family)